MKYVYGLSIGRFKYYDVAYYPVEKNYDDIILKVA
jgi:hypothetical protein